MARLAAKGVMMLSFTSCAKATTSDLTCFMPADCIP